MNVISFTVTTAENLTFNMNGSANILPSQVVEMAAYLNRLAATMTPPAAGVAPATTTTPPKVA